MRHSVVTKIVMDGELVRGFRITLFGEATRLLEKANAEGGLACFSCYRPIGKGKYYSFSQCMMANSELIFVVCCEGCTKVLKDAIGSCMARRDLRDGAGGGSGDAGPVPPAPGSVRADPESRPAASQTG